jgi:hypothetical protein
MAMTKIVTWMAVGGLLLTTSGCATGPARPSAYAYPLKGQTMEQMTRDQAECQVWAQQQSGFDPATDTAKGAGVGAVIGALGGAAAGAAIGAATGNAGRGAAIGAASGGLGGAAIGGTVGYTRNRDGYDRAYSVCMKARNYEVR